MEIKNKNNLEGLKVGKLTVLNFDNNLKKWKCVCECENICFVTTGSLNAKHKKSCGRSSHRRTFLKGLIFKNKKGLEYEVIEDILVNKQGLCIIKFFNTGSIKKVTKQNIKNGSIRDDYYPSIYGVACSGQKINKTKDDKMIFKRWYSMIERCYNVNSIGYKSYGEKGVKVSESWLCFENFYNDIPKIKGYEKEKYLKGELQLDKDILIPGNKIYSLETCLFVDEFINKTNQPTKQKRFIAISPNGDKKEYNNVNLCGRENSLVARSIFRVLNKEYTQYKNWKFYYI